MEQHVMAMADMKMSKSETIAYSEVAEKEDDGPQYPYGLCIHLEKEQLAALGITEMPEIGASMMIHANAYVKTVSQYDTKDGKDQRVELQITEMDVQPGEAKDASEIMYGKA
jgi:hypothetical protein